MRRLISQSISESDHRPLSSEKENQIDFLHQIEEDFCNHRDSIRSLLKTLAEVNPEFFQKEFFGPYRKFEVILSIMMADIKNSAAGLADFDKKYHALCDHFTDLKNKKIPEKVH